MVVEGVVNAKVVEERLTMLCVVIVQLFVILQLQLQVLVLAKQIVVRKHFLTTSSLTLGGIRWGDGFGVKGVKGEE